MPQCHSLPLKYLQLFQKSLETHKCPLQAMNSAVAPEVEAASASVGELVAAVTGLVATGVVAWSLATLKGTGAHASGSNLSIHIHVNNESQCKPAGSLQTRVHPTYPVCWLPSEMTARFVPSHSLVYVT